MNSESNSASFDYPEGGFDGLVQAIVCTDVSTGSTLDKCMLLHTCVSYVLQAMSYCMHNLYWTMGITPLIVCESNVSHIICANSA